MRENYYSTQAAVKCEGELLQYTGYSQLLGKITAVYRLQSTMRENYYSAQVTVNRLGKLLQYTGCSQV